MANSFKAYEQFRGAIPVAVRSKAQVCCRSLAETAGSNPSGARLSLVNFVCCVGRGFCNGPMTHPVISYRVIVNECVNMQQLHSIPTMSSGKRSNQKKERKKERERESEKRRKKERKRERKRERKKERKRSRKREIKKEREKKERKSERKKEREKERKKENVLMCNNNILYLQ